MERLFSGCPTRPHDGRRNRPQSLGAAAMCLLLLLCASGTAWAQTIRVTGTVTSPGGRPVSGAVVRVVGGDSVTATNEAGRYNIGAPSTGTLTFSSIGYTPQQAPIAGRTTIDVTLGRLAILDQVVVTGYSGEQRRSEITGAVASVNLDAANRQTSASVLQRLDANVTGVTVSSSGSPGSRSTVRIRGISSFQNNDPLYVVDGTPVQDSYVNFLNPNDIASIQVLKDAAASSIYGSRASNGVVIIETVKSGAAGPPRTEVSVRTGVTTPVRGYDDFLIDNTLDYAEIVRRSYVNAGQQIPSDVRNLYGDINNPSVPAYIWCGANPPCANPDLSTYSYPNNLIMPGSAGTNWWDAVFGTGRVADANLSVRGAGTGSTYALSFNYFDQQGTAAYNTFRRGSVRVNTSFTRNRFTVGENFTLTGERAVGGLGSDALGEDNIIGKNILLQPVVPIRDVQGNYASGKAVGLGNSSNPLKIADAQQNNTNVNGRIFGNLFANYDITEALGFRTSLGINAGQNSFNGYDPIFPEDAEPIFNNRIWENNRRFNDFALTNTLRYSLPSSERHSMTLLLGQETIRNTFRFTEGSINNIVATDVSSRYIQDAIGDADTKNVFSNGGRSALLSYFGKADYTFNNRYTLSGTLRYDGSSNLGPDNRWGLFPAIGLAWRLSEEAFLRDSEFFTGVQLRAGYGVTGNQQIPAGRIVSQFGGNRDQSFYDISGGNSTLLTGYRLVSLGNQDLKWEENRSVNAGFDAGVFGGAINLIFDAYERVTDNLLFAPPIPGTAGVADAPFANVGQMRNRGFDFSVGHRSENWGGTVNVSRYSNRITRIDGERDFFYGPISTRFGNQIINQVGIPISSFYGLTSMGFFRDSADVAAHADQDGAAPGRIKFRDTDGDGEITLADRSVIGSPHPDFTAGLDLQTRRGPWDAAFTVFGTFGNDIFDAQKEYYVFRNFATNVREDLLTDSWTPDNLDAKYPQLDVSDTYSSQLSSFYVEDGSYVRLRNVQLGYTLPTTSRYIAGARVYIQAENLFTITGYDGLDPALSASESFGASGDTRDQYRGIDRGNYPSNRQFSIGISTQF